jgi:DNA-binding NarL/FixJ family response regulator
MHSEPGYVAEAIRAGACGYLLKQATKEELVKAVTEVVDGRTYITPLVDASQALLAQREEPVSLLTARQREVLQLAAEGLSAKEIAAALNISSRTADFHKNRIMQNLRLHNTAELTRYAIKHGLIEA